MRACFSPFLSPRSLSLLSLRECAPLTGCHWYGGSRASSVLLGSSRGGMCADGNRWWFILEACWATSTLHVPFFLSHHSSEGLVWLGQVRGTDGPFWRRATAQCSLLVGLHWSSQEQTQSPSVGNIQELQSVRPL